MTSRHMISSDLLRIFQILFKNSFLVIRPHREGFGRPRPFHQCWELHQPHLHWRKSSRDPRRRALVPPGQGRLHTREIIILHKYSPFD